jgi:hypothetical protein
MATNVIRLEIVDSVRYPRVLKDIEMSAQTVARLNAKLPCRDQQGLKVLAIESVTRKRDLDYGHSHYHLLDLKVVCLVEFKGEQERDQMFEVQRFLPRDADAVRATCSRVVKAIRGANPHIFSDWVVIDVQALPVGPSDELAAA